MRKRVWPHFDVWLLTALKPTLPFSALLHIWASQWRVYILPAFTPKFKPHSHHGPLVNEHHSPTKNKNKSQIKAKAGCSSWVFQPFIDPLEFCLAFSRKNSRYESYKILLCLCVVIGLKSNVLIGRRSISHPWGNHKTMCVSFIHKNRYPYIKLCLNQLYPWLLAYMASPNLLTLIFPVLLVT